jgi:hypothetical protein
MPLHTDFFHRNASLIVKAKKIKVTIFSLGLLSGSIAKTIIKNKVIIIISHTPLLFTAPCAAKLPRT